MVSNLNQLSDKGPPSATSLQPIDMEMNEVLNSSKIPDFEKLKMYHELLQKYLNRLEKIEKQMKIPIIQDKKLQDEDITSPPPPPPPPPPVLNLIPMQREILNAFQKDPTAKEKAKELMRLLDAAQIIFWDNVGNVKIRGKEIKNANIVHLIKDTLTNKSSARVDSGPIGWQDFTKLLYNMELDKKFIKNKFRKTYIRQQMRGNGDSDRRSQRRTRQTKNNQQWTDFNFYD